MRQFPKVFADHLATGTTTLCRCWRLIRQDGFSLGFTDHDQDLTIGGLVYCARTGLEGSEVETGLGLAIGGAEISGALTADALTDTQISSGLWDNATIETWLVNWCDVNTRILLDMGQIGEIKRADHSFIAEIRGVAHRFDEDRGRIYQSGCNADLGDARCGVNLEGGTFKGQGSVTQTDGRLTVSAHLNAIFASGWFENGSLTFSTGNNAGAIMEIRQHGANGLDASFALWRPMPAPIQIGDQMVVRAGCNKSLDTCRSKFSNAVNFRGFPFIPTNDFVLTYARQGDSSQNGGVFPI